MIIDKAYASMDHHGDGQREDRLNDEDKGKVDKDYYKKGLKKLIDEVGLRDTFYEPYFYPESVTRRLVSGYYVDTDPPVLTEALGERYQRFQSWMDTGSRRNDFDSRRPDKVGTGSF